MSIMATIKKKLAVLLVLIAALVVVTATESSADYKRPKVAILEFQQTGNFPPGYGLQVSEWLTSSLAQTGRFELVERSQIDKIIGELKLGTSGLVDGTTASRLGKVFGVKEVITGTISNVVAGRVEINARLVHAETASIRITETAVASSLDQLRDKVGEIAEKISQSFPLQSLVAKRSGKKVTIALGRMSGVREGMKFHVYVPGEQIKNPKTGEVIDEEEIPKGDIIIREVKENASIGEIISEQGSHAINETCLVRGFIKDEEERVVAEQRLAEQEEVRRQKALQVLAEEKRRQEEEKERARIAEEKRRLAEEEERKVEDMRRRVAEERRLQAEEKRRQEEAERQRKAEEEERRQEEIRLRKAEEQAEKELLAEEKRLQKAREAAERERIEATERFRKAEQKRQEETDRAKRAQEVAPPISF